MNRFAILLGASALASPAITQHQGHAAAPAPATVNVCTPEHAAMGHCILPESRQQSGQATDPHEGHGQDQAAGEQHQPVCTPEHAAMGHCILPEPATPHTSDPHAKHHMPATDDPHAGHDQSRTAVTPPVGSPPPEAFTGPAHAADALFGDTAMTRSRREMYRMHGAVRAYRVLIDRLETRIQNGRNGYAFEAEAWYGGDIDKLWLKAESHGEFGERFDGVELQGLWIRAISPFFDLQTGVRYDAKQGPDRAHLVLGIQGLAPYWIEIDFAAFLSDRGDITARLEAEHDMLITQRLILQPRGEFNFALQDRPQQLIGGGLSEASLGARLRYRVTPLFSPYVGVEYGQAFGNTRRYRRLAEDHLGGFRLVAGLRTWF
jgi:copper resistance protein B